MLDDDLNCKALAEKLEASTLMDASKVSASGLSSTPMDDSKLSASRPSPVYKKSSSGHRGKFSSSRKKGFSSSLSPGPSSSHGASSSNNGAIVGTTGTALPTTAEGPQPTLGTNRQGARHRGIGPISSARCLVHRRPCHCYLMAEGQPLHFMMECAQEMDRLGPIGFGKKGLQENPVLAWFFSGMQWPEEQEEEIRDIMWDVFDSVIQREAEKLGLPKRR